MARKPAKQATKPKKPTKARKPKSAPVRDKLDAYGLDQVLADIADRMTLTQIAEQAGVSIGTLSTWIDRDPERLARVREARKAMARVWDEQAETEIRFATDDFGLRKAKELAHHYRWRAAKVAPADYGDKVQHADADGNNLPAPQFVVLPVASKPE